MDLVYFLAGAAAGAAIGAVATWWAVWEVVARVTGRRGPGKMGATSAAGPAAAAASAAASANVARGFEWARRDLELVDPHQAKDVGRVRFYSDWSEASETVGNHIKFSIQDANGIWRDVTFSEVMTRRFFGCATPTRAEWHGKALIYSQLLGVARHYKWVREVAHNKWRWTPPFHTRDRRLYYLNYWLGRSDSATPPPNPSAAQPDTPPAPPDTPPDAPPNPEAAPGGTGLRIYDHGRRVT